MNVLKVDGVGTFPGGTYDRAEIDGVTTVSGDLSAEIIEIDGVFTLAGSAECRSLTCNGTGTIRGDIHAEALSIGGVLTMDGMVQANTLICNGVATIRKDIRGVSLQVDGVITALGGKIESGTIVVGGGLSAKNAQISADSITVNGRIQADEIVGESITIYSSGKLKKFLELFSSRNSTAKLIEATTVVLEDVTAGTVSGQMIRLTGNCIIDKVDCCGTLYMEPACQVREISGEYTMGYL